MRLLIEFIAGRGQRNPRDFQPADLGVLDWQARNSARLRLDLADLDQHSAHLSKARAETLEGYLWVPDSALTLILLEFSALADAVEAAGNGAAAQIIRDAVEGAYYLMRKPTLIYPLDLSHLDGP